MLLKPTLFMISIVNALTALIRPDSDCVFIGLFFDLVKLTIYKNIGTGISHLVKTECISYT